ncbi:galactose-1-phosphate uridylyltransferase [Candidatus Woesearchaeota archaeon]|nr:galactose-1-phosphate uridylyltransferase [Candidatus Woesearchaeota archaeon]
MIELRKDPILERYVIISEKRGKRPHDFKQEKDTNNSSIDFFAPGNEHLTPPEIARVEKNGKWTIRVIPNKFAFLDSKKYSKIKSFPKVNPAYGRHEVIVETPSKIKQLWDLSSEEIFKILEVYSDRIYELSGKKHIKYVQIFKNHGKSAGTSLFHSHTQVAALPLIPPSIEDKLRGMKKNKLTYESLVKKESKSKRKALETKHFVAICPFASRFNFEVHVFPKKHYSNIAEMPDKIVKDLALILKKILRKLKSLNCSYNFHLHYAPEGKAMLFHMEITPRLASWAGFEHSSGIIVNSISPETAAKFYKSK